MMRDPGKGDERRLSNEKKHDSKEREEAGKMKAKSEKKKI